MIHRPVRILVVENDPAEFEQLESVFEQLPENEYMFSWTRSSKEALRQLKGDFFDVCLATSGLEAQSDRTFEQEARQLGSRVPIILLSEREDPAMVVAAKRALLDRPASVDRSEEPSEVLAKRGLDPALLESVLRSAVQHGLTYDARRQAHARYQSTSQGANEGIWDWDLDRNVVYYSDRWKQQLGYTSRELGDAIDEWFARIHPDDLDEHQQRLRDYLEGRTTVLHHEYRVRHKDGSYRWMLCRGKATADDEGQPVRLSGTHQDITERKASEKAREEHEDRLQQSQKMEAIGRLAGGVAHDFNNLLLIMLGYTRLLIKKTSENSELRPDLLEINKAGEQAARLTRQLLAFSRKGQEQPAELDLGQLVRSMDSMIRMLIGEDIELTVETPSEPTVIFADQGQMEQILLNLAANGRDAMPKGGQLILEVGHVDVGRAEAKRRRLPPGGHVRLAVTDTGNGMDAETRERLFEPFFTTKENGAGNGLGLSTVYAIVKRCGGSIEVDSVLGQGTRFELLVPRVENGSRVEGMTLGESTTRVEDIGENAEEDAVAIATEEPEGAEANEAPNGHERILLVEDNDTVRGLVKRILDSFDFDVLEASNAERALEICAENEEIDLLLTDVIMPKVDGRELAERIRKQRPDLKVLFMSGYPGDRLKDHGVWSDATDFIPKPFEAEDLAQKVREVLER